MKRFISATLVTLLSFGWLLGSFILAQSVGDQPAKLGAIAAGFGGMLIIITAAILITPRTFPAFLWRHTHKEHYTSYQTFTVAIIPLFMTLIIAYLLVGSFYTELLPAAAKAHPWPLRSLGLVTFAMCCHKLISGWPPIYSVTMTDTAISVGADDYYTFDYDAITKVEATGTPHWKPKVSIFGDGEKVDTGWWPGHHSKKEIGRVDIGGMNLGHWPPEEIADEIRRRCPNLE